MFDINETTKIMETPKKHFLRAAAVGNMTDQRRNEDIKQ
jgi:hypothetical protein